jgi:molybdopterin synthase catalytic subunit
MDSPPAIWTAVTAEPIDPTALLDRLGSSSDGAIVLFVGRVRDLNEGRQVARLEYEAYREMADATLRSIVEEAAREYEVAEIAAVHRTGSLQPGDTAVAIAVAAPHRDPAYSASRYVIEQVKLRLPVWKRETYVDGEAEWQQGSPGVPAAAVGRRGGADADDGTDR